MKRKFAPKEKARQEKDGSKDVSNKKKKPPTKNFQASNGEFLLGSYDIARFYYPPNNEDIGLIVNLACRNGSARSFKENECVVEFQILSENSSLQTLLKVCRHLFP